MELPAFGIIRLFTAFTTFSLSLIFFSQTVLAGPNVEVALHASFPSPPFVLELLETAAKENSSAYFPLLNGIATGRFSDVKDDRQLYKRFVKVLTDHEFLSPDALASWKYAVALHETAPQIEAQYQFWNTSVRNLGAEVLSEPKYAGLEVWRQGALCVDVGCSITHEDVGRGSAGRTGIHHSLHPLDFDRFHGEWNDETGFTMYMDPTFPGFGPLYMAWQTHLIKVNLPFRLRYKTPHKPVDRKLYVSGYGVEIALKRTDYIVIDDRDAQKDGEDEDEPLTMGSSGEGVVLDTEAVTDVKPLSSSELRHLGLKTSDYIMKSDDPFLTLQQISQDFPKHASQLSSHSYGRDFIQEHRANRNLLLPPGSNIIWMNGMQIGDRDLNPYTLLDKLRHERQIVKNLQDIGLSPPQAIQLLTHEAITAARSNDAPQRYDFRDDVEGGGVIIWMNDLEKDKRYNGWPSDNIAVLQRVFPGQPPNVRKNMNNLIWPVNFEDHQNVVTVIENFQMFVKRLVPIRIGLVPVTSSKAQVDHTRVIYYLESTYGLTAVMEYLRMSATANKLATPSKDIFDSITANRKLRRDRTPIAFANLAKSEALEERISKSKAYLARLGADGPNPPIFGNGIPIPATDEWMQTLTQRISVDVPMVQQAVYYKQVEEGAWLPSIYMRNASLSRNSLIIPEDENDISILDLNTVLYRDASESLKTFVGSDEKTPENQHRLQLWLIADFGNTKNTNIILNAIHCTAERDDISLSLIHNSKSKDSKPIGVDALTQCIHAVDLESFDLPVAEKVRAKAFIESVIREANNKPRSRLVSSLQLPSQNSAILLNGRFINVQSRLESFSTGDFNLLINYENQRRILPAVAALQDIGLTKSLNKPSELAQICSTLALSNIPDSSLGILDNAPPPRMSVFEGWNSSHTCIETGQKDTSPVQIVASIDPASEAAQRWVSLLAVLSRLTGVHTRIFLNPKAKLESLPVTRFYRQVLSHESQFEGNGSLLVAKATFKGLPEETLLTTNLDVPPSWLVAPKDSIHDLDNIKLSSSRTAQPIEATYEIESILIEGHSKDVTLGRMPRGAQLLLQTDAGENSAGTIVMANLGYFQFKANPGVYRLALQPGRSEDIYNIDSAYSDANAADNTTLASEITLKSFKGSTLFPRLSRKPGKEADDVLEESSDALSNMAAKGAEVQKQVWSFLTSLTGKKTGGESAMAVAKSKSQADINIFSVASGHLYERMLNIMMVSVMRHTKHSVKFWFIEQFLSPSFKTFLPIMAEEYGFDFEMVSYKWPHWLRAQTEKQRVIWGYKILFLDVLFPLDLDKVIFVDADQIVRTDMYELVTHDLEGAPYGFTPMCDDRVEMEGFRFWKQGYWKNYLRGLPYHISALYVVDLKKFRQIAAGDRLRQQYHQLSADPNSLSNLDQDLPNHMQMTLPIHSLPQEWLWCETWCSDESLTRARTIDLCNNPMTKEPKLDRARRQVPEWTEYDDEIAALAKRRSGAAGQAHIAVESPGEQAPDSAFSSTASTSTESSANRKDEL